MEDYIFLAVGVVVFFSLFFIVKEQSSVIIERLGKFHKVAGSGINFKIPFIDKKAATLNLRLQQLDVLVETKTLDNVFVNTKISVQYQVVREKVKEAYYSLNNPTSQISSYIFDEVRAAVPKLDLDDLFSKKDEIAISVNESIAGIMDDYGYAIIKTLITDIDPDSKVKESMNRINAAKRDREATIQEADAKKITIIKEAEAEAESKRLAGEGIAKQRLEIIRGFKESVEDFQRSLKDVTPNEVMQFVLMTQYFDTLNNIGTNSKNSSILVPHTPGALKDFQEQIITGTLLAEKSKK
ncbi:MAG TPA: SPFH domain-containing protein [Crocinitomicaceae bacterium]|nr:SPFH domain-containing protein [Crocinitomicaceae bacterium]